MWSALVAFVVVGQFWRPTRSVVGPPPLNGLLENFTFPYMARLRSPRRECTGTIIGQQWILTSLWCVGPGSGDLVEIWAGYSSFTRITQQVEEGLAQYRISKWVYIDKETQMAMIFIDKLDFSTSSIQMAKIARKNNLNNGISPDDCILGIIIGTGTNGDGKYSDFFRPVESSFFPESDPGCQELYKQNTGTNGYICRGLGMVPTTEAICKGYFTLINQLVEPFFTLPFQIGDLGAPMVCLPYDKEEKAYKNQPVVVGVNTQISCEQGSECKQGTVLLQKLAVFFQFHF